MQGQVALGVALRGELGPAVEQAELLILEARPGVEGHVQVVALPVLHAGEHRRQAVVALAQRNVDGRVAWIGRGVGPG